MSRGGEVAGERQEEEMIDANYAETRAERPSGRSSSANFISRLYAIERSKQCVEKI